jgi:hypothetical protein
MGKMECSDRMGLFNEVDVLDGCEIDRCAFDRISCDAEPGTECGGVSRRVVVLVLSHMGGELGIDNPAERHKPERKSPDYTLLNLRDHRLLSKSRCFDRLLFLNPRNCFIDFLLGQQPTLDIFLHAAFLIDEDADG